MIFSFEKNAQKKRSTNGTLARHQLGNGAQKEQEQEQDTDPEHTPTPEAHFAPTASHAGHDRQFEMNFGFCGMPTEIQPEKNAPRHPKQFG